MTSLRVINPANETKLADHVIDTAKTLETKFGAAKEGQKKWAALSIADRQSILRKFYKLISDPKVQEQLAVRTTEETGRPIALSRVLLSSMLPPRIEFFIEAATKECAAEEIKSETMPPQCKLEQRWEPRGVIGYISAWNFPILMFCDSIVPCLVAGNAVLYKPSEYCIQSGKDICELMWTAGVPRDVLLLCVGAGTVGAQLCQLPLDGMLFVGSYVTGKKIATSSVLTANFTQMDLEMGGKDAIFVCHDVDLSLTVSTLVEGAYVHSGQSCDAVKRIYIEEEIYDSFVNAFTKAVAALKMGDPLDPNTQIGPLTRYQTRDTLDEQVKDAIKKGARVTTGGKRASWPLSSSSSLSSSSFTTTTTSSSSSASSLSTPTISTSTSTSASASASASASTSTSTTTTQMCEGKGYFYEPTVIADVMDEMLVSQEESFGPLVALYKVPSKSTDDDVLKIINNHRYGLTAGIFTKDAKRAMRFASGLTVGSFHWNSCGNSNETMCWSGRKDSGCGMILSKNCYRHCFLRPKSCYFFPPS
eukprot:TRINITY_DN831_c0_g1_i1.p1 TRINITY_DN831_c0_g1~~TRINITY_DN831_c0_g1_i1.p1  ORF type:complete len:533 (+),score=165.57 TRINITY_DN831_c0_g1_i1:137-1735(+)